VRLQFPPPDTGTVPRPPRSRLAPLLPLLLVVLWTSACVVDIAGGWQAPARRTPAEALIEARRLAHNGEWEAAAQVYREALDDPMIGPRARVELAALLDRTGRDEDAAAVAAAALTDTPTDLLGVRAWFLYGSALADLGRREEAVAAYARYVALGGFAAAYARVEQARLLADTDPDGALAALEPLLRGAGPVYARRLALRRAGETAEQAGRAEQALGYYGALLELTTWTSDRIFALAQMAALRRQLDDLDGAAEAWRALVGRFPASAQAEEALRGLDAIGRPADPLSAGLVHYRRRNDQQARDLFNAYLRASGSTGPGAAVALFYLGALAERRGDTRLALENYQEAYDAAPTGPLAVEALWERAGVLEYAAGPDDAIAAYRRVAERFPASTRAPEAAFRAGYIAYTHGRGDQARTLWRAAVAGGDAAGAARAAFWAGRATAEQGDADGARTLYAEAARRDPTGYYGLRAAAVLAGQPGAPAVARATLALPADDWPPAEAWLASWAGTEDTAAWAALSTSEEWRAALELLEAGRFRQGSDAVALIIDAQAGKHWLLYRIARAMQAAGQPHLSYIAVARLVAAAPEPTAPAAGAILRLAYPVPWTELVQQHADEQGIDPLLLYALMRQESAFDPEIGSTAGAFGLTQFIAGTAQEVAQALGMAGFRFADLARPHLAIRFGAYYLSGQLRTFGGNVYHALAAYNGGAGNVRRWLRPGGAADVDRFYEEVDFAETKLYLRLVLQYYAWYRFLYGVVPAPSLTRG
jgi:soluble lytic murein transglycosylase